MATVQTVEAKKKLQITKNCNKIAGASRGADGKVRMDMRNNYNCLLRKRLNELQN